jgi:hypothetical protein
MAFYGNTYETLPRENGFICLKLERILNVLSLISVIQTLFCFKIEEVEQLY